MHELSIALSILDLAAAEARRHGGGTVRAVHVRVGPLSGVVKEALVAAFELARDQSPLPESRLVVEDVPLRVYCERCRSEQLAESPQALRCGVCGMPSGHIVGGKELELRALEIEA